MMTAVAAALLAAGALVAHHQGSPFWAGAAVGALALTAAHAAACALTADRGEA